MIASRQLERHVLSGLFKNQKEFWDIDGLVNEYDFDWQIHRTIYAVAKRLMLDEKKLDSVLLATRIKDLGIAFKDDVNIFEYLESLFFTMVTKDSAVEAAGELRKVRIRRDIYNNAAEEQKYVLSNPGKTVNEIIAAVDAIHSKNVLALVNDDGPSDLFLGIEDAIEANASKPKDQVGFQVPFPQFSRSFGGIRAGDGIYAIVSRPKHGKSSFLLNMAQGVVANNDGCKVLILDTEMGKQVSQYRAAAAETGIPMWHLETGNFAKNPTFDKQFKERIKAVNKYLGFIYHLRVGNKPVDEVLSVIRRWYHQHVGTGNPAMIVYDYLKVTGEAISESWKEYQVVGEKVNKLTDIGSKLNVPIFTACQLNRSAEDGRDDSAAIAASDRLQWFAAFIGIFRRKRLDEIGEDGEEFGTHKLIPLATRFQGQEAPGHQDLIKIPTGPKTHKYVENFINYEVRNFRVTEKGSLKEMLLAKTREAHNKEVKPQATRVV